MRSAFLAHLLIATLAIACAEPPLAFPGARAARAERPPTEIALKTPLVQLLAHPRDLAGRRVWTSGVAEFHFEGSLLFLTREHRDLGISPLGLSLDHEALAASIAELSALNGRYVTVLGEVSFSDEPPVGHPSVWLLRVSEIRALE